MPRRKITFDVAINTPSATREAERLAKIFQSKLGNIQVGTGAKGGGGGSGGGSGSGGGGLLANSRKGMPGSSIQNLVLGSAQFAFAGQFYQFFSKLPQMVMEMDKVATANKRAAASFVTLAGGVKEADAMTNAFIQGSGQVADKATATQEAMRLFNIGMAQNAQEMRAFVLLSRGMSQALGRPTEYIQEQLSLALANQSLLRFDQLGLSIERHQELVAQLADEDSGLSKEIIFQNALLTQATEKYLTLANAQEALATSTEIASREIKDGYAMVADFVSENLIQPIGANLAMAMGAEDFNVQMPIIRRLRNANRAELTEREAAGGPQFGDYLAHPFGGAEEAYADEIGRRKAYDTAGGAVMEFMAKLQGLANLGATVDVKWIEQLDKGIEMLRDNVPDSAAALDQMSQQLITTMTTIENTVNPLEVLDDALLNSGDSAKYLAEQAQELGDSLVGSAAALAAKLVEAGVDPDVAKATVGSQASIEMKSIAAVNAGAMAGDAIDDAAEKARIEREVLGPGEAILEGIRESEAASKRASSALESAAKKAEKAFVNAADSIMDAYEKMLQGVEGLFGTSEVTEEDLLMAKMGYSVNKPDDALRRLRDVAFNGTKRDDVDLGLFEQILGQPAGTDPRALSILADRAWNSGAIGANPELFAKLVNMDAVKGGLHEQEMAALGTQNMRAMFGLGTEQGNEFLKVFGVEALDPIEDGLITEITTRGPIMGETLANAMFEGFKSQSLTLPWVQSLMNVMESEVGRRVMAGLNTNVTSDLAEAEDVP
jgi:hypothetical protein